MKYADVQIGEVFENSGYKWMKILTEKGMRNMRLTANLKRNEAFSHIGSVFMDTDKVNFSSSWDYKSTIDFTKYHRYYYVGSVPCDFVFRIADDVNYYFVRKLHNNCPIYIAVSAEGNRFQVGYAYELEESITCEVINEKTFYYNEGEL